MDQKEIDYFDNSKRVFDYPYFGDFESVKKDLFFVTEDFSLNWEEIVNGEQIVLPNLNWK